MSKWRQTETGGKQTNSFQGVIGVQTRVLSSICSLWEGYLEEAVPGLVPKLKKTQLGEGRGKAFQTEEAPRAQGL